MSNYFVLQLQHEHGVMIDSDAFLGAFTMDRGGQRVKIGPWSLGPGHRPRNPSDQSTTLPTDYELVDQEGIRVSMTRKWEKYYLHAAGHIPYAVCKAKGVPPLVDNTNGGSHRTRRMEDGNDDQDFEIGGIGGADIDGESEMEDQVVEQGSKRPGGRPLNGKGIHCLDKIKTAYIGVYV